MSPPIAPSETRFRAEKRMGQGAFDKRRSPRAPCRLPCRYRLDEEGAEFEEGLVVTLGSDGARLEVGRRLAVADRLHLQMEIPDLQSEEAPARRLACLAKVIWAIEGERTITKDVGISFLNLDPRFVEWLRGACLALRRHG